MQAVPARWEAFPSTRRVVEAVLRVMPDHAAYLEKSFANRSAATWATTEDHAALIERIQGGSLESLAEGYRWLCEMIREEELHFRRTGAYRNSSFAEVDAAIYQDAARMGVYMEGLLATEVLWVQHARAMDFFVHTYLPKLPDGYRHLEIGPGHGLLLHHPAIDPRCAGLSAWDISPASLELTRACLHTMETPREVSLEIGDIMAPPPMGQAWDSVVVSEVLEHLEDPLGALQNLHGALSSEGRLYINVPVNAPTVDHIYLFRSPEEAISLVERGGYIVDEVLLAPGAGYSLERARRLEASITVALVARPA